MTMIEIPFRCRTQEFLGAQVVLSPSGDSVFVEAMLNETRCVIIAVLRRGVDGAMNNAVLDTVPEPVRQQIIDAAERLL